MEVKKPYTPPTITQHGDAVKETRGWGGPCWESVNGKPFILDIEV